MTFLSPYWLLAAAAILVPVAIHLWNRRQGKTVKVGSLRWLEASASRRWSSIQLSDVWLLVLRCLILILLAMALAEPFWKGPAATQQPRKAVFVSPEVLHSTALPNIKPTVDALLQRGYTLHRYTLGFEAIPAAQWQALSNSATDSVVQSGNHWGLLPALAQVYDQPQDSVWLFTSDQQRHFVGAPTALQENIRWIPVALETATQWVQAAYTLSPDSLLLITGQSTREGGRYTHIRVAANSSTLQVEGSQAQLQLASDSLLIHWNNASTQRVRLQKEPLRLTIAYDQAQQPEVRYLQAALQAISRYTGIPFAVQLTTDEPTTSTDWLFWLSDAQLPTDWVERAETDGTKIWLQPASEPAATTAHLATAGAEKIRIRQLSDAGMAQQAAHPIWQSTAGEPLLTAQPIGQGQLYHFRSGFAPAWSQLGQSAQLPELLLPILLPQESAPQYDARALDEGLLKPTVQPAPGGQHQEQQQYSLIPWLVLLAFLLFLTERFITSKRTTT